VVGRGSHGSGRWVWHREFRMERRLIPCKVDITNWMIVLIIGVYIYTVIRWPKPRVYTASACSVRREHAGRGESAGVRAVCGESARGATRAQAVRQLQILNDRVISRCESVSVDRSDVFKIKTCNCNMC
jgi:hypothetical protein